MNALCSLTKDGSGVLALKNIAAGKTIIVEPPVACFHFTYKVRDSEVATELMAKVTHFSVCLVTTHNRNCLKKVLTPYFFVSISISISSNLARLIAKLKIQNKEQ